MATKEIKFSEYELKKIQSIQKTYQELQLKFGEVHIKSVQIEQQADAIDKDTKALEKQYVETQNNERSFLNELSEKYGKGSFNLETGVFTPEVSPTPTAKEILEEK